MAQEKETETETTPPNSCLERIEQCEFGLLVAEEVISNQGEVITVQDNQIKELSKMVKRAHAELEREDVWYKSKWFTFTLGVVAGGLAVDRVKD